MKVPNHVSLKCVCGRVPTDGRVVGGRKILANLICQTFYHLTVWPLYDKEKALKKSWGIMSTKLWKGLITIIN